MKKERRDDSFIKHPYFKGGHKAMSDFIASQLKYPKSVLNGEISGEVYLKYSINLHGDVFDVKVIGGLDEICNAEAIRVVKLLKFIVPKNPKKLKITFHKNITIHFKINIKSQQTPILVDNPGQGTPQYTYALITSRPATTPESEIKKEPVSYNYTITIKSAHPTS